MEPSAGAQPMGAPRIGRPMDQKTRPRDEPAATRDREETAKKDHPAPDALARDDLPEPERIEQQNDLA